MNKSIHNVNPCYNNIDDIYLNSTEPAKKFAFINFGLERGISMFSSTIFIPYKLLGFHGYLQLYLLLMIRWFDYIQKGNVSMSDRHYVYKEYDIRGRMSVCL